MVLLAAGGAVVATVIATLASMLAAEGPQAVPPAPRAEVSDVVETSVTTAPDGSTSTVVVTVSTRVAVPRPDEAKGPRREDERPQPGREPAPAVEVPSQPQLTSAPPSNPPSDPPASPGPISSSASPTQPATTAPVTTTGSD